MDVSKRKAIALMSGGLDSQLAARLVKDQGIEVIGLHLLSPFGCREDVQKVCDAIGVPLLFREKGEEYLDLVKNPRYGYGRAANPCIDCRIFMFEMADDVRVEQNADFIVTGEVLGQRPMSQQRHAMDLIDRKSQMQDLIVRPLSAEKLPPTLPEREGWVDRTKFFGITGRGRRQQLNIADSLSLTGYAAPGGGCALTESSFEPRLRDFHKFEHFRSSEERLTQSELLRYGRHYRLSDQSKAIVSRNQAENQELETRWKRAGATFLFPKNFGGPSAVIIGSATHQVRETVGRIMRRFGKGFEDHADVGFESSSESGEFFVNQALEDTELEQMRL